MPTLPCQEPSCKCKRYLHLTICRKHYIAQIRQEMVSGTREANVSMTDSEILKQCKVEFKNVEKLKQLQKEQKRERARTKHVKTKCSRSNYPKGCNHYGWCINAKVKDGLCQSCIDYDIEQTERQKRNRLMQEEHQTLMRQKQEEYELAKETFPWIEQLKQEIIETIYYKIEDMIEERTQSCQW